MGAATRSLGGGDSSTDSESEPEGPVADDAGGFDAAVEHLLSRRAELAAAREEVEPNFTWTLRGGRWTAEHLGVPYDSFRAYALPAAPLAWCRLMNITATATFSIRLYSEDGARMLAEFWCHRMEWLYSFWTEADDPAETFRYSAAALDAYVWPPAVAAARADASVAMANRMDEIAEKRPADRWMVA